MNRRIIRRILKALEKSGNSKGQNKPNLIGRFYLISKAIFTALATVIVVLILILSILELFKNPIIIEGFDIPGELQKAGYNERVLISRINDHFYQFSKDINKRFSNTGIFKIDFNKGDLPASLTILESKISLNSLIRYVRDALGLNPLRVRGEIVVRGETIDFTMRVKNKHTRPFYEKAVFKGKKTSGKADDIYPLLHEAALHILKYTYPYIAGVYYLSQLNTKEAKIIADLMLDMNSSGYKQRAYLIKSVAYYYEKKYALAAKHIEEALKHVSLESEKSVYYNNWALYLYHLKQKDDALEKVNLALSFDKESPNAYLTWGMILELDGKYVEAIEKTEYAIKLKRKFTKAYTVLGELFFNSFKIKGGGNKVLMEKAVNNFEKALELEPENIEALEALARLHFEIGDLDKSFDLLSRSLKVDPNRISLFGRFVREMRRQKKVRELKEQLIKMKSKLADKSDIINYIKSILAELDK